jgi:hypothetical protein
MASIAKIVVDRSRFPLVVSRCTQTSARPTSTTCSAEYEEPAARPGQRAANRPSSLYLQPRANHPQRLPAAAESAAHRALEDAAPASWSTQLKRVHGDRHAVAADARGALTAILWLVAACQYPTSSPANMKEGVELAIESLREARPASHVPPARPCASRYA